MTEYETAALQFLEKLSVQDALLHFRQKAWEKFLAMGLPSRDDEAFRYVSLRDLYAAMAQGSLEQIMSLEKLAIRDKVLPECAHSYIVFVNGKYQPALSDTSALSSSCSIYPLSQAMQKLGHFLSSQLLKAIQEEKDPFALLNLALHADGVFVYISPKQNVSHPIQCIQVTTAESSSFSAARIQLALGAAARAEWISTHLTLNQGQAHCASPSIDLFLEQGAELHVYGHLSPAPLHWCFDTVRAHLKRDSMLKIIHVLGGSKATRQNIYVECAGENAQADVKGLWKLTDNLRAHAHVVVDHLAPHTRSMQLFKGILLDASQSSFEGKIIVRDAAQKTEAYQMSKHLLLGQAAIAHSKPNLEIFADDVKASHGATIARPDAAQLFYLKSRGIEESQARALLMHGFYQEIIDEIPYCLEAKHE
jgi:Fe-S cluster assembly protein SufD